MRYGLHIFDIIFKANEIAETHHRKHFDSRLLFADKFRLDPFETEVARNLNDFIHHRARETLELMQITIGLLVTFAAVVLGLVTASVKQAYDNAALDRGGNGHFRWRWRRP